MNPSQQKKTETHLKVVSKSINKKVGKVAGEL